MLMSLFSFREERDDAVSFMRDGGGGARPRDEREGRGDGRRKNEGARKGGYYYPGRGATKKTKCQKIKKKLSNSTGWRGGGKKVLAWVGAEVLFLTRVGRGYLIVVADLCSLVPKGPSPKSCCTECMVGCASLFFSFLPLFVLVFSPSLLPYCFFCFPSIFTPAAPPLPSVRDQPQRVSRAVARDAKFESWWLSDESQPRSTRRFALVYTSRVLTRSRQIFTEVVLRRVCGRLGGVL